MVAGVWGGGSRFGDGSVMLCCCTWEYGYLSFAITIFGFAIGALSDRCLRRVTCEFTQVM
jgi:hypothetical protein